MAKLITEPTLISYANTDEYPPNDPRAHRYFFDVLRKYNVRQRVIDMLWNHCIVTIEDWDSVNGGGWTYWGDPIWFRLLTVQDMAIVHEGAHGYRIRLSEKERQLLDKESVRVMKIEADSPQGAGPLHHMRQIANWYRYGRQPDWPQGMRLPGGGYNETEVFAGFCSASIEVTQFQIPPLMKYKLLNRYFTIERVYLPVVMG